MQMEPNTPEQSAFLPPLTVPDLLLALEQKEHIIEAQRKLIRLMEEKLRLSQLLRFGASSEKLPMMGDLFDEAELPYDPYRWVARIGSFAGRRSVPSMLA